MKLTTSSIPALALATVLIMGSAIPTNAEPKFIIEPSVHYNFGETEYILDIVALDTLGQQQRLKSQLEYPLDVVMPGLGVHVIWDPQNPRPWDSRLSVHTSLTNPNGAMTDRDWTTRWRGFQLDAFTEVSSTESEAEMRSLRITAELGKTMIAQPNLRLRLFGAYRFEWIDQEIFGIEGWQLVPNATGDDLIRFEFDEPGIAALTYRVHYHLPHAGLELTVPFGAAQLSGSAAYAAVAASDKDEHLLRNFTTNADVTGHGLIAGAEVRFYLNGRALPGSPCLSLTGGFMHLSASGTKTQYWYGDEMGFDPDTGDEIVVVPEGTRITGIPHDINSTQGQIGIEFGLGF